MSTDRRHRNHPGGGPRRRLRRRHRDQPVPRIADRGRTRPRRADAGQPAQPHSSSGSGCTSWPPARANRVTIPLTDMLHPAAALSSAPRNTSTAAPAPCGSRPPNGELDLALRLPRVRRRQHRPPPRSPARASTPSCSPTTTVPRAPPRPSPRARPRAEIAVIGGGFTGVEAASELAEQHPDAEVTLYCAGDLLAEHATRPPAGASRRTLRRKGVRIVERRARRRDRGQPAPPRQRRPAPVRRVSRGGSVRRAGARGGAAGFRSTSSAGSRSTRRCGASSDPRVIGAGDAIVAPDRVAGHLRMGCAAALPLGAHAAATLLASIRGTEPPTLSVGYVVQCVGLGRRRATSRSCGPTTPLVACTSADARVARSRTWSAPWWSTHPTKESNQPGAYRWPKGPKPRRPAEQLVADGTPST